MNRWPTSASKTQAGIIFRCRLQEKHQRAWFHGKFQPGFWNIYLKLNCCWNPLGFQPTTLRNLFGCSNHWATGNSVAKKGEMWVFDSICITQLQSEKTTDSLAHNCITQSSLSISEMRPTNQPIITEGRGFKSHLGLGFFRVPSGF